jgi:hypothetical protein
MSLSRVASAVVVAGLLIVPLTARPVDPPHYQVIATLPNVVDGQPFKSVVFDRTAKRLYVGSQQGIYFADLTVGEPQFQGPLLRRSVWKVEPAWDLGRVFFAGQDYIGYVDAKGGEATQIATGNASDLAYEPTKQEVYASFTRSAEVQVFDARTGKLNAKIKLPGWNASELESVPGRVFCMLGGKDGIYAIDATTHKIAPWKVDGKIITPGTLEADPNGTTLFMARQQELVAIDIASAKVTGKVTMYGMAAMGFDTGTGLLLATFQEVESRDFIKIVALRPDKTGLVEVESLQNPSIGGIGVEPTINGFIQNGNKGLLVWSSGPAPAVK